MDMLHLGDERMRRLDADIAEIFNAAITKALKNQKKFFKELRSLLDARDEMAKMGEDVKGLERDINYKMTMLMRGENLIDSIADALRSAGRKVEPKIQACMEEMYRLNANATFLQIGDGGGMTFSMLRKDQVKIILSDSQPVFSKIAYNSIREQPAVLRALRSQMAQAALLGEGQRKVVARIRKVTGMAAYNAKRVAQTEHTRIRSQARADSLHKAAELGVQVTKEWSARMHNTRDSHAALDGKVVMECEKFRTIWGNELAYPGDPSAPAREVINCHCVIIPDVMNSENKNIGESKKNQYTRGDETGIIPMSTKGVWSGPVQTVGKIDKRMYSKITDEITTEEVVMTSERVEHTKKHNNVYEKYEKYIPDVLADPDFIYRDKRPNTGVLIKEISDDGKNIQIVLRLHVASDDPTYKNSIISCWDINARRRKNYEANKEIVYRRGDL